MSVDDSLLYELRGVGKAFTGPTEKLTVLRSLDMAVAPGDLVAIVGASGSGKSTLLHMLGTLDTASWGEILFRGRDLSVLGEEERARLRNREMGFIFQFHHLLPEFDALENAAMPGVISGMPRAEAEALAAKSLEQVGLGDRMRHGVTTLSGGERQRTAIARAIFMKPKVLLADEPTGDLDERNGEMVADLLFRLNKELGMTMIVVTHNPDLARKMDRCLELRGGELYAHEN